jgi:hypothetical protein
MEVVLLDQAGGEGAFARALGCSVLRFGFERVMSQSWKQIDSKISEVVMRFGV